MIMVSVSVGKDKEPIVGLLLDTHLLPTQGSPQMSLDPITKKLIQGSAQQGIQGFGVVATDQGFIVGPLASMIPIMNPDQEDNDGPKAEGSVAAAEEILP